MRYFERGRVIIYLYPKCSTCQKAQQFLEKNKLIFTLKDIVKEPPSVPELQKMLHFRKGNLAKLLNTSGLLYREMQLTQKVKLMTIDDILLLLSQHGMLIKRPFLLGDTLGLTGFKDEEWTQVLLKNKGQMFFSE